MTENILFVKIPIMVTSGLMTIDDLAGYLKVSRRTIYEWLKTHKIPAVKLIGQWRFKRDKIDAWLDSSSAFSTPNTRRRK
ncbi:MAG: helix-turn-helix domain-containing protein [Candidatus Omnitrophica bacterium]|nr:helix-turn-helix domain-containing protein [Candidatus Omnitrophota bacterium]